MFLLLARKHYKFQLGKLNATFSKKKKKYTMVVSCYAFKFHVAEFCFYCL